jgi:hypothetical protein
VTTAAAARTRRATLLTAAALGLLGLSGCQLNSPVTTTMQYAPADGVQTDGESLLVRDLLVVSNGNGAPAVVSASLINRTAEPLTVTVSVDGQPLEQEITVDPRSRARLDGTAADGTPGDPLVLEALESPAGQSVQVRLDTGEETLSALTPVLLPRGAYERFADDAGGTAPPLGQDPGYEE